MQPTVGEILEGKVTGITKFGAFVTLPDGKNGLVHISEIANTYVNDVHEHLTDGQEVRVKIIGINEAGKINLSIKQALPPENRPAPERASQPRNNQPRAPYHSSRQNSSAPSGGFSQRARAEAAPSDTSFEDKLKQFMQESDSRISDSRAYGDKKGSYRRRRD